MPLDNIMRKGSEEGVPENLSVPLEGDQYFEELICCFLLLLLSQQQSQQQQQQQPKGGESRAAGGRVPERPRRGWGDSDRGGYSHN